MNRLMNRHVSVGQSATDYGATPVVEKGAKCTILDSKLVVTRDLSRINTEVISLSIPRSRKVATVAERCDNRTKRPSKTFLDAIHQIGRYRILTSLWSSRLSHLTHGTLLFDTDRDPTRERISKL